MPDTNITIDAVGNVIRGTPGKMTELDIEQKGGHVTGRTDHTRPKVEKPAAKGKGGKSKNMSLDQIIGRSGARKTEEVVGRIVSQDGKSPTQQAAATQSQIKQAAETGHAAPVAAPKKQESPTPASTPAEPKDNDMWTAAASVADNQNLPFLTIEHRGIKLHFVQADIEAAKATPTEKRDDMEQAIIDYGEQIEREQRERAEHEKAVEEAKAAQQANQDATVQADSAAAGSPSEVSMGPVTPSKKLDVSAGQFAKTAPVQSNPVQETASSASSVIPSSEPGHESAMPETSKSPETTAGNQSSEGPAGTAGDSKPRSSQPLDLGGGDIQVPTGKVLPAPASSSTVLSTGPAATEKTPLRRVSVNDICATLELSIKSLKDSLQATGQRTFLGVHPDLYLYYSTVHDGDITYLFGYGANIAYVRARGGMLYDCNNRFGIDGVCAWVNEMTQVIRRTDI